MRGLWLAYANRYEGLVMITKLSVNGIIGYYLSASTKPVLTGSVASEVYNCIQIYCGRLGCQIVELNVQTDHVHLLVKVLPKRSISDLLGAVRGRTTIRIFKQFPHLRKKPYWGNHFWAKGYCVDTVGVDSEMIREYVKYQEKLEKQQG